MRKVYLDITQADMCIGVCVNDAEVVLAGTTVNAMSVKHKNCEYLRFAEEYDIQFIFADNVPEVDFYSFPMVDVFAIDSVGGYIGSVGQSTDLEADIPVCYIDAEKMCYLIATNGNDFLSKVSNWKADLMPYKDIEFFDSLEMAQKKYEFLDRNQIEQEVKSIERKKKTLKLVRYRHVE